MHLRKVDDCKLIVAITYKLQFNTQKENKTANKPNFFNELIFEYSFTICAFAILHGQQIACQNKGFYSNMNSMHNTYVYEMRARLELGVQTE